MPLHIVQHGHNREACFFGEDDSLAYPHWLGEALKESGCALHAYVLMTNPVHWLLLHRSPKTSPGSSSRQGDATCSTSHRTGTLWDSRYKSSLVQEDTYLCQRYIELNPVRAAI